MFMNPHEQIKIQEELDTNIGRSRTPNMKEIVSLRYLNAAWRESLRMMPPIPLGVPHLNTVEDTYKGYYIPKGTLIQQNIG
jgi:cytochrome P450